MKDSSWALIGNVANKGLALIAGIVIARFLGKETFGEYGAIKNALLYIAVFSTYGIGFSATKYVSQAHGNNDSQLSLIIKAAHIITLCFSGIMALLLIIFTEPLCEYLELEDSTTLMRYTAVTVIFNALVTCQIGVLSGLKLFKNIAKINCISGIVTFVTSVVFTYFYSIDGAIFALLLSNVANCILNFFLIKKETKHIVKCDAPIFPMIRELVKFSTPIALQESLFSVSYWAGLLILMKMSGYGEVGLYSAAGQWAGVVLFIPSVLQNVMLSHLSGEQEKTHHSLMLKRMLAISFVSTFIPFVVIMCSSSIIISFYGESFTGLSLVLNTAVFGTIIKCFVQVYIQEFISRGKAWQLFFTRFIRDIVGLVMTWGFISIFHNNAAFYYYLSILISSIFCLMALILQNRK